MNFKRTKDERSIKHIPKALWLKLNILHDRKNNNDKRRVDYGQ